MSTVEECKTYCEDQEDYVCNTIVHNEEEEICFASADDTNEMALEDTTDSNLLQLSCHRMSI